MNPAPSRYQRLLTVCKWTVFILATALIVQKLFAANSAERLGDVWDSVIHLGIGWYGLVLLFTILNWGIESLKWRYAVRHVEPIPIWQSVQAVLAGLTLSSFVPYRVGEYIGRVMYLAPENRVRGSAATIVASLSQLCVTCIVGLVAILLHGDPHTGRNIAVLLFTLILTLVYFNPKWLYGILNKIRVLKRYADRLSVLEAFTGKELAVIGLYSVLRYFSFAVPYVILIKLFGIGLSTEDACFAVSAIFLVQTLLPAFLLSDIAIRGSVPLGILSSMIGHDDVIYMAPGYILYCFNLLMPALAGGVVILLTKYKLE